jgi:hypothetical protein
MKERDREREKRTREKMIQRPGEGQEKKKKLYPLQKVSTTSFQVFWG